MSTQEILAELPHLSAQELELIAKAARELEERKRADTSSSLQEPRTANFHPGSIIMAPDFDDPLPDEFLFGSET